MEKLTFCLIKIFEFFRLINPEKSKKEKLELLDDTIKYYAENPKLRRCQSLPTGGCRYSPFTAEKPTSDGCAIGRLLTPKLQLELDEVGGSVYTNGIMKMLPRNIRSYGAEFLYSIQTLHDGAENWDMINNGLSETGVSMVNFIKKQIDSGQY